MYSALQLQLRPASSPLPHRVVACLLVSSLALAAALAATPAVEAGVCTVEYAGATPTCLPIFGKDVVERDQTICHANNLTVDCVTIQ